MSEIKPPYFVWNLKKWRIEHGLDTPEANAYKNAMAVTGTVAAIIYLIIGYIVGRAGF